MLGSCNMTTATRLHVAPDCSDRFISGVFYTIAVVDQQEADPGRRCRQAPGGIQLQGPAPDP